MTTSHEVRTTYFVQGEPFTADEARLYAEARLGRSLTAGERALDLVGLDLDLAEGKERLTRAIEEEKRAALERRLHGGSAAMEISEEMSAAVAALVEAGRRHAREEIERLTGHPVPDRSFIEGGGGWFDRLLGNLISYLTALRVRVNNEAGAAEFRGESRITEELIDRLDDRIPGARDAASRIVSGLLIGGLGEVYETNADLFPCFIYSAVMDGATCSVCRTYDGTRYETWAEGETHLPGGGPNPLCLGDGRCRCRLVPCAPGDVEPEPEVDLSPLGTLRSDVDAFERMNDQEFAELAAADDLGYDSFNQAGGPSSSIQRRVEEMKAIGRRVDDEANRRWDDEAWERNVLESEARVDASRERKIAELNRNQEIFERVRERIEREMFGERGARTSGEYDRLITATNADAEVRAAARRLAIVDGEHHAIVRREEALTDPLRGRAESLREVLADLRDLDGQWYDRDELTDNAKERARREHGYDDIESPRLLEMRDDEARYLPTDWIEASNDAVGFRVAQRSRGHYSSSNGMVAVSGWTDDDLRSTMLHELGHRMEDVVPEIKMWEWAFMDMRQTQARRNGTYSRERLRDLRPGSSYEAHEISEPDDFTDPYIGRDYGGDSASSYEILTMGLEGVFHGDPIDDDHRDFVLGLLATIRGPAFRQRRSAG